MMRLMIPDSVQCRIVCQSGVAQEALRQAEGLIRLKHALILEAVVHQIHVKVQVLYAFDRTTHAIKAGDVDVVVVFLPRLTIRLASCSAAS